MARKIPVLIDEEVYYHLQQLRVPSAKDLGDVVRYLLLREESGLNSGALPAERTLRQRDLLAELQDCCGRHSDTD